MSRAGPPLPEVARGESGRRAGLAAFSLVLLAWYAGLFLLSRVSSRDSRDDEAGMLRAAATMRRAMAAIVEEAELRGIAIDPALDPNRSGLVGLPLSGITTTLGSLAAKRSGAQPDAAALLVKYYREAGIHPGDRVAIDSSGSFPGFAIAAVIAAESIGAEALVVASIGSSTYGANHPAFTLVDMLAALERRGVVAIGAAAVSAGGAGDEGSDMDAEELAAALGRASGAGCAFLEGGDLARDVAARRAAFEGWAPDGAPIRGRAVPPRFPALLVSIGGNWSSGGERLGVRNGLLRPGDFTLGDVEGEGLIESFLRDSLPVLRLLDVKSLCAATGLPWDPIPWPAPGSSALYRSGSAPRWLILAGPALAFALGAYFRRRAERGAPRGALRGVRRP